MAYTSVICDQIKDKVSWGAFVAIDVQEANHAIMQIFFRFHAFTYLDENRAFHAISQELN